MEQTAQCLLDRYGNDLKNHCLVFPNRRAGIFLLKHLATIAGGPLWAPKTTTINDLFLSVSPLKTSSTERLVVELFKLYKEKTKKDETIDNFYFWGEMLLNDFDDVDKYLVDAKALFTNLADLHAIDEKFGGLTEEQIAVIRKFIENFRVGADTDQKRDFEFNWSLLLPLYIDFKDKLRDMGLAYEGMAERDLIEEERVVENKFSLYKKYHFIGFNALNNCEKRLMKMLKTDSKAEFYWDYEKKPFFDEDQKAAFFIEQNIKEFEQSLPTAGNENSPLPKITIIDIPSDSGQAKLLPGILDNMGIDPDPENHHKTAVVLADENLLPALLSSVPPEISDINVTMGYPFKMTVVYSLLRSLLSLQLKKTNGSRKLLFGHREVLKILSNPLVEKTTDGNSRNLAQEIISANISFVDEQFIRAEPFLKVLFTVVEDTSDLCRYLSDVFMVIAESLEGNDPLVPEFLFRANQVLNRLEPIFSDSTIVINKEISIRLIDRIFREIKVPFRGEPLRGLQIMGILESRAIDFDNLIILSANEGILPKASLSPSYIPYNLREVFGLPVISHQDSIYAYYFTRLLTRAKNVVLVYNSSTEGMRSGEMSRFLLRLKYGHLINPTTSSAKIGISGNFAVCSSIPRTPKDVLILEEKYIKGSKRISLSPSAINSWLNCSARFYYSYVCGMKEENRLVEGIDPARIGTMLHEVINRLYSTYIGEEVSILLLDSLKKDQKRKKEIIEDVLGEVWFGGDKTSSKTGNALIVSEITQLFVDRVLDIDSSFAPFKLVDLERTYTKEVFFSYAGNMESTIIGGKIDRIDERFGVKRLIDYKTGKADLNVNSLEELFDTSSGKINDAVVQTLTYSYLLSGRHGYSRSRPVIYALRGNSRDEWDDKIIIEKKPLENFSDVESRFTELLTRTLKEIFDPGSPFKLTTDTGRCAYCPYKKLCKK